MLPPPPLNKVRAAAVAVAAALPIAAVSPATFVAVAAAFPVAAVSLSLLQTLCRNCRHRVAVAANQSLHRRRCYCRHLACHHRFAVAIPASLPPLSPLRCRRLQAKPTTPPLLSPLSCPSSSYSCCRSTLIALPPPLPNKAIAAVLPVATVLPLPFQTRCRHCFYQVAVAAKQTHAVAVSVASDLPVAAVSPSPFQPCCRHCCHRVAVTTKQIPHCQGHRCCHCHCHCFCRCC